MAELFRYTRESHAFGLTCEYWKNGNPLFDTNQMRNDSFKSFQRSKMKKKTATIGRFPFQNRLVRYISNSLICARDPRSDIIQLATSFLSQHQQRIIIESAIEELSLSTNEDRNADTILMGYHTNSVPEMDTIIELFENRRINGLNAIKRLVANAIRTIKVADDGSESRLDELGNMFRLSDSEKDLIVLFHILESCSPLCGTYDEIVISGKMRNKITLCAHALSIITGLSRGEVNNAIKNDARIFKSGLMEAGAVAPEISDLLSGYSNQVTCRYYSEHHGKDLLPLSEFRISSLDTTIIQSILNNGIGRVLLWGDPGCGKTTYIRALAKANNKRLLEVQSFLPTAEKDSPSFRQRALIATQNIATAYGNTWVLVDEADALLNMPSFRMNFLWGDSDFSQKASLNNLVESLENSTIFITNHINDIHESTKRRMDFSLKIEPLNASERIKVWSLIAKEKNVQLPPDALTRFSDERLNPAVIENILKLTDKIPLKPPETIERMISAYKTLTTGSKPDVKPISNYSIEGLNIRGDLTNLSSILVALDNFNSHWDDNNMAILIYGKSGVGKSAFVSYLGNRLNRKVIQVCGSDILDMWVGQSEKKIRASFEDAESQGGILFYDEADSLLSSREGAARWAVSQVNEILVRLDRFHGLFIAATNNVSSLDSATARRFTFKVEFDTLKPDGILHFYNLFLSPLVQCELTDEQRIKLESCSSVTIGNLVTVKKRFEFIPERSHDVLIAALKEELLYKSGRKQSELGFSRG